MFHVSMLRKCLADPSQMLENLEVELRSDLIYKKQFVQIINRKEQVLRRRIISLVKILLRNYKVT